MPLSPDHVGMLARLRALVVGAATPFGADVFLIGSFAKGTVRQWSDVDVAIDGAKIPPDAWHRLADAIENSTIPRRVELIDLSRSDDAFRRRVEREGIRWNG